MTGGVTILGIFVADTAYTAARMPDVGETIRGSGFSVGAGGKGSNQAVAAARAGASVSFISRIGRDTFGKLAEATFEDAGIRPVLTIVDDAPTGAAFIYVNETTGDNAIIVYPGAAGTIGVDDVEAARDTIAGSAVFVTQLEQPVEAARHALQIARNAGVVTIFNPAPAEIFPEALYGLSDFIVPNETEAAALVGFPIDTIDDARRAGDVLLARGAGTAVITLGGRGVLLHGAGRSVHVPVFHVGPVIDTTGAGDAFVGALAAALARGAEPLEAVRFGCAGAAISVTRRGTAPAMPFERDIAALLSRSP